MYSPKHESVRAHDKVMRTSRTMQSAYNRHAADMQTAVHTAVECTTKEVPTQDLGTKNYHRKVYELYYLGLVLNKLILKPDGL